MALDKNAQEAMESLLDDNQMQVDEVQPSDLLDDMEPTTPGDEDPNAQQPDATSDTETPTETETDEDADDASEDDDGETETETEKDPDPEEETTEVKYERLMKEHEATQARLAQLSQQPQQQPTPQQQQQPPQQQPMMTAEQWQQYQTYQQQQQQQQPGLQLSYDPQDFLTSRELDDLMDNPAVINVGLNRMAEHILQKVLQPTLTQTFGQVFGAVEQLPGVLNESVRSQLEATSMAEEFYRNNEDLKPYRKLVGIVTAQTLEEMSTDPANPPMWVDVFAESAKRTRKELGLKVEKPAKKKQTKAALPGAKTSKGRPKRTPKQTTEPTQQDMMAELLEE